MLLNLSSIFTIVPYPWILPVYVYYTWVPTSKRKDKKIKLEKLKSQ